MPARKDFAIIHFRALLDERVQKVAGALAGYMEGKDEVVGDEVARDLSIATAAGVEAMLALHLLRQTDDGVFRGDLGRGFQLAIGVSGGLARGLAAAWKDAGLVVEVAGGWYLKGFNDAYAPLITKRAKSREQGTSERSGKVASTSRRHGRKVATRSRQHSTPTVAVAVTGSTSTEEASAPPSEQPEPTAAAEAPPEDPGRFPNAGYLTPGLRQDLALAGINLRTRVGKWYEWEKTVLALCKAGKTTAVFAALKDPGNGALQPWQFAELFSPRDGKGRPLPPQAAGAADARKAATEDARLARLRDEVRVMATRDLAARSSWLEKMPLPRRAEAEAMLAEVAVST